MEKLLDKLGKLEVLRHLRQHAERTSPHDMRLLLNPEEVRDEAEAQLSKVARGVERMRNILIIVPIMITWISLAFAGAAYIQNIQTDNRYASESFFQAWQEGFPAIQRINLGLFHIPLQPVSQRLFTFSDTALLAGSLFLLLILLTAIAQFVEMGARKQADELYIWLTREIDALSLRSHLLTMSPGYENEPPWIQEIREAVKMTRDAITEVKAHLLDILRRDKDMRIALDHLKELFAYEKDNYEKIIRVAPELQQGVKDMTIQQKMTQEETRRMVGGLIIAVESISVIADAFAQAGLAQRLDELKHYYPPLASTLRRDPNVLRRVWRWVRGH